MAEEEFVRLNAIDFPRTWRSRAKLLAAAALGGAMLFSPYSADMGVLVIAMAVFLLALPRLSRSRLRRRYAKTRYLHGPVTYGVSGRGFWLSGEHLNSESSWPGLTGWQERQGWMILSATGMPPVYLPLGDLRAAGRYEQVLALARVHARQYEPVPQPPRAATGAR